MRTYTKYKLTEPQLRRLSELANGGPHHHGNALTALGALTEPAGTGQELMAWNP